MFTPRSAACFRNASRSRQAGQANKLPDAAAAASRHAWQTWILQHGLAWSVCEAQTMQAPPGIFPFLTSSFVWQRFLCPGGAGWVCSLHSLRQAKNCGEVSEEYWLAVKAARSPKNRPLAPNERSQAWAFLLASVLQYASPLGLPKRKSLLAAACCGARARCKRLLWPSTHADQLGLQVAVSGGLRQQSRSKQLSGQLAR